MKIRSIKLVEVDVEEQFNLMGGSNLPSYYYAAVVENVIIN